MNNQKGQAVVEYILMFVVMAAMISSILAMVKRKYIGDITKCDLPANKKSIVCKLNSSLNPTGGGGKPFQYYPFKK